MSIAHVVRSGRRQLRTPTGRVRVVAIAGDALVPGGGRARMPDHGPRAETDPLFPVLALDSGLLAVMPAAMHDALVLRPDRQRALGVPALSPTGTPRDVNRRRSFPRT